VGVGSGIILRWTTPAGATSYNIYRNGLFYFTVLAPDAQYIDAGAGVISDTQYCYTISAVDAAGNESAQSVQVCGIAP
jgi:hypothetical protein